MVEVVEGKLDKYAPGVTGRSAELVEPPTYRLPSDPTANAKAASLPLPPR